MGCLRYTDKKRFIEFIKKGNYSSFYEVLKVFYQEIKFEWIEAGNECQTFEEIGPKIVMILDNASYHKKREIIKKIEEIMPNIK